jgi:hypothetical protein
MIVEEFKEKRLPLAVFCSMPLSNIYTKFNSL